MKIIPGSIPTKDLHQIIVGSIAPRPIAFVSTVDEHGVANLAPYSFFNAFSSNPPILVFSSNRRVGNNTTKDTLRNVELNRECVIQVVTHDIVRQMTLTSIDYPADVSEFDKGGFTPIPSEMVKPPRVKESPIQFECKVKEIIALGDHGGAGHLIICEVLLIHLDERILDDNGRIDPHKLNLMGRLGRAYYVKASGDAIMTYFQPFESIALGFDRLPYSIKTSTILTGNDLAELASVEQVPNVPEKLAGQAKSMNEVDLHRQIKHLLTEGKKDEAVLWAWAKGDL